MRETFISKNRARTIELRKSQLPAAAPQITPSVFKLEKTEIGLNPSSDKNSDDID